MIEIVISPINKLELTIHWNSVSGEGIMIAITWVHGESIPEDMTREEDCKWSKGTIPVGGENSWQREQWCKVRDLFYEVALLVFHGTNIKNLGKENGPFYWKSPWEIPLPEIVAAHLINSGKVGMIMGNDYFFI